jgi:formamidopyrimidine-DNA glycosylase
MPELPEVETVVRTLAPAVCGRAIVGVQTSGQRLRRPWKRQWACHLRDGRRIVAVRRRGKWIIMELTLPVAPASEAEEPTGECLLVHLGMTGRLYVVPAVQPLEPHTHLVLRLTPGDEELRFRDPRRFGSVGLYSTGELEQVFQANRLGPEPFALTAAALFGQLQGTRRCLKAILLDQRVVAGVGNIYADEALFEARLHPARLGNTLSRAETGRLRRAMVKVLRRAIDQKGSTIRDYFYGDGQPGGYQNEFRVYQQAGQPCPRCRTPIQQLRLAGRATHYCPKCQVKVES